MMIRKTELVRRLARETRLSQGVVTDVLTTFERQVKDGLRDGHTVQLMGFGSFYTRDRAEGRVRNLQTKEMMTVPASRVAAFKAGDLLKRAIKRAPRRRSGKTSSGDDQE